MDKKMENEMETGVLMGYRDILGLYWDNGKANGSYFLGLRA